MQKSSFLFLLILLGVALIAANYAFSTDGAGRAAIRFMADSAFFLFSVSLILGPLAVIDAKYAQLIEPRRAVGLAAFFFAAFHIALVSGIYFGWQPLSALAYLPNIVAVPAAFVLLLTALTASDYATQKFGMAKWKTVQRLVYIGFAFVLAHFILITGSILPSSPLQLALLALAVAAIALQFYGFYLWRKRAAASTGAVESAAQETERGG